MQEARAHIISQLQKDILLMQGFKPAGDQLSDAGLGLIREAFPFGCFPQAAIHELFCTGLEDSAATGGFVAAIVSSLMKTGAPSVWISASKNIFPAALQQFKLDPHRIIFVQAQKPKEILWIIEEALKCDALSAVVAEIGEISFTESRRLQLVTEQSKVTGFLIRHNPKNLSTAAVTRWRIKPLPSEKKTSFPGIGLPRWHVALLKVRNGKPGSWQMQWRKGKFELLPPSTLLLEQRQRKTG